MVITGIFLSIYQMLRGRQVRFAPRHLFVYAMIAILGTIIPNSASYRAAVHLDASMMSVLVATVPLFALPIAIALGRDSFSWMRTLGILIGFLGIVILVDPWSALGQGVMLGFVLLYLVAPLFYAIEGNYVDRYGTADLGPIETLAGASIIGAILSLGLALGTGQFISPFIPIGPAERALVISSLVHGVVYATYVWMVRAAGAVFTAQVSYLVTGFGVVWAFLILQEVPGSQLWIAMVLIFLGMFLVSPRDRAAD
jgi:drug/metabolite transporter (DMT)-like permease